MFSLFAAQRTDSSLRSSHVGGNSSFMLTSDQQLWKVDNKGQIHILLNLRTFGGFGGASSCFLVLDLQYRPLGSASGAKQEAQRCVIKTGQTGNNGQPVEETEVSTHNQNHLRVENIQNLVWRSRTYKKYLNSLGIHWTTANVTIVPCQTKLPGTGSGASRWPHTSFCPGR